MNNSIAVGSIDPGRNTISELNSRAALRLNSVNNNSWVLPKKYIPSNRQALDRKALNRHISTESRASTRSDGSVLSTVSESSSGNNEQSRSDRSSSSHSSGASLSVDSTEVVPVGSAERLSNSRTVYYESTTHTTQYSYMGVICMVSNDETSVNQTGLQPASQAAIGHNDGSASNGSNGSKSTSLCGRLFPCISKRK